MEFSKTLLLSLKSSIRLGGKFLPNCLIRFSRNRLVSNNNFLGMSCCLVCEIAGGCEKDEFLQLQTKPFLTVAIIRVHSSISRHRSEAPDSINEVITKFAENNVIIKIKRRAANKGENILRQTGTGSVRNEQSMEFPIFRQFHAVTAIARPVRFDI